MAAGKRQPMKVPRQVSGWSQESGDTRCLDVCRVRWREEK